MNAAYLADRVKLLLFKLLVRTADSSGAYKALAAFLDRFTREIGPDGSLKPLARESDDERLTVLFLNRSHYVDAVVTLARRDDLRCIDISTGLLRFLLAAFVRQPTLADEKNQQKTLGLRAEFRMAQPGSRIYEGRKRYRTFLRRLLPHFFEQHGIDIVFNSDVRYRREADFSRVASELGVPHICMPRDSMFIIPATFANAVRRHRNLGTFHGDQLVVQNEATRQMFLKSGHARDDQITVLGSIRMDNFIKNLSVDSESPTKRKMVLMFCWPLDRRTPDGSEIDLHRAARDTVRAMARLAALRPDIDFAVKLKKIHIQTGQRDSLRGVVNEVAKTSQGLGNFSFYGSDAVASRLIRDASVICAMQSTTVLEAAAARKPVILPHFKALRMLKGADEVLMYGDSRHLFDVPDTEEDLHHLIQRRLEDGSVPEDIHQARLELFGRHVAPLSGDAEERFVHLINEYAEAGRHRRADIYSAAEPREQYLREEAREV